VRFDHPDDDIHSITALLMRRFEHGIGFPHARVGAKKYL
jgi:hypothetical protein